MDAPWGPHLGEQNMIDSALGGGAARAEDVQGTPTKSQISPNILVHEEKWAHRGAVGWRMAGRSALTPVACFVGWCLGFRVWRLWGSGFEFGVERGAPGGGRAHVARHAFGVWGFGFGGWGLWFVVCGLWFVVCGLGFGVWRPVGLCAA